MKYESVKTLILIILVFTSIILTWSLWTYQPQYADKTDDLVEEIIINDPKETASLIKPSKILFHMNEQHFGTYDESEINKIMKYVKTWDIRELKNISSSFVKSEYLSFLKKNGHVEIQFFDTIPLQIFKTFMNINDTEHSTLSFDRIVINVYSEDHGEGTIYFVSNQDQMVYEAKVDSKFITDFERNYYPLAIRYPEQQEQQITETYSVFLPKDSTKTKRVDYFIDTIEIETFIDRLFPDPTRVKKDDLTSGEVHTDGSRLLRVYDDKNYIEFINTLRIGQEKGRTTDLITTSIDYINGHVGWTSNFRFFEWDQNNQNTLFRLFEENYPVFNKQGQSEIIQQWDNNEIVEYVHPTLSLEIPFKRIDTVLLSGNAVIEEIKKLPNFEPEKLEYVTIGYELQEYQDSSLNKESREFQDNSQLVTLQPIWCYRYNGTWMKLEFKEDGAGGKEDGLE
ncbi:YycH family regulatory protein [Fredinandcohnia sp. 179-A 10B2 NHS]|uniref:YycH family regulatory protein n=1 Tax=Fredinandcohnia sp. 179-A 10B2 NHS TaxID=3235176 RepID=UPI0039A19196